MHNENTFTCCYPYSNKNAVIIDSEFFTGIETAEGEKYIGVNVKSLIDTGANRTCISHRLASACNLERISVMKIVSAQGTGLAPVYKADIKLPCGIVFQNILVTEVSGSDNFDVIIGMDILSQGDIAFTGSEEGLVFSMRFPSKKEPVDFSRM